MPTRVRFVFNKVTGEVEEFLVDDQDRRLPEAEHDRIAAGIGEILAVSPRILEVLPGDAPPGRAAATPAPDEVAERPAGEASEAPRREGE